MQAATTSISPVLYVAGLVAGWTAAFYAGRALWLVWRPAAGPVTGARPSRLAARP
ncbi:hypothetical protein [Pseudonocardia parietis]|uniref:Uncharacterized protein n=1 Tax=Pseudonocardia parietis TaxID=570936 RepID=A0ABS4VS59_9PSEU|nr:hypothetical protein [Pseudonocardia parietis]MBP2366767.1 hypothetical protein [Pseudonocardia parietis]